MLKKMLKNKKGFSLIELIVVIAILGVIAVIAVPSVMNTLETSKINADVASAQAIHKAVTNAYAVLNSDSDTTNDLKDISVADGALDGTNTYIKSIVPAYIDSKKPSSAPTNSFNVAVSKWDSSPVVTVSFTDSKSDKHEIDKTGKDKVTPATSSSTTAP